MKVTASKPREPEIRIALSVEEAQMLSNVPYDDSLSSENKDRIGFDSDLMSDIEEALDV